MSELADSETRNGIQVIARAASVLRALKGTRSGMSLGQIAEQVGLPRSTVQRIVGALEAERLVISSNGSGGIRLGPELHALAESARFNIADIIRPRLVALSSEIEETVDLSCLRGGAVVFIDQIPGSHRLRAVSSVGDAFPLTPTANGKACLSLLDDTTIKRLVRSEWSTTGRKGARVEDFLAEIATVRATGIAYDRDEHTNGISAIGIAFRDPRGDIYAVSVPMPTMRFADQEQRIVAAIGKLSSDIAVLIAA